MSIFKSCLVRDATVCTRCTNIAEEHCGKTLTKEGGEEGEEEGEGEEEEE